MIIFVLLILLVLINFYRVNTSSMTLTLYSGGFITIMYALTNLNFQRSSFFMSIDNEKKTRMISVLFQSIRRCSLVLLMIFPLFLLDPILKSNLVSSSSFSKFLTYDSLGFDSTSIFNHIDQKSLVGLDPIHVSSFQALQEDGYTKAILQTWTPFNFYENPKSVLELTLEQFLIQGDHQTEYKVISKSKTQIITSLKGQNDFEIISFTLMGRNVYSLCTENISMKEHLLMIEMMKDKNNVEK